MKKPELKQEHLKKIYNLMLRMGIKVNEKNYLTRFFKLPQLNCKFPHRRSYIYKNNNIINKKILKKIELLEKCFE
jgi:hypothetical protein